MRSIGFGLSLTKHGSWGALGLILSANTIAENAANGAVVGTVSVAGAYTGTPAYGLVDTFGGTFTINSSTGVITKTGALNFESIATYLLAVTVSGVTPSIANVAFVINVTDVVEDTTPVFTPSGFTDVTGAAISTPYTSNTITISDVDGPSDVTITGGEYSKNGGAFTSSPGSAVNGDTFAVRAISSGSYSTSVNVFFSVGGNVTPATTDTFTVVTMADPEVGDDYSPTYHIYGF